MSSPVLTPQDWEQVKATSIATGSLKEAAKLHGVKYTTVRQQARRNSWPTARRTAKQAQQALEAARATTQRAQQSTKSTEITANPAQSLEVLPVTPVTSTATALENSHRDYGKRGRLALAKAACDGAEHLSEQGAETILDNTRALKDLADVSGKAGGWADDSAKVQVNVLNMRFE